MILAERAFRRGRSLALLGGILVATASFPVLTGASDARRLEVRGAVDERFVTAYDILVRPRDSQLPLVRSERLVQQNFLSGIFGGIRMDQYRAVRELSGIEVAAPIGMIGYVLPANEVPVELRNVLSARHRELFRVRVSRAAERGMTRLRDADSYVYVTSRRMRPVERYVADGNVPGAFEIDSEGRGRSARRRSRSAAGDAVHGSRALHAAVLVAANRAVRPGERRGAAAMAARASRRARVVAVPVPRRGDRPGRRGAALRSRPGDAHRALPAQPAPAARSSTCS